MAKYFLSLLVCFLLFNISSLFEFEFFFCSCSRSSTTSREIKLLSALQTGSITSFFFGAENTIYGSLILSFFIIFNYLPVSMLCDCLQPSYFSSSSLLFFFSFRLLTTLVLSISSHPSPSSSSSSTMEIILFVLKIYIGWLSTENERNKRKSVEG